MSTTAIPDGVTNEPGTEVVPVGAITYREPWGRSISRSLSSKWGRILVYLLVLLWTIPTFGILISSFRPEEDVKTSGWWNFWGGWGWSRTMPTGRRASSAAASASGSPSRGPWR